MPDAKRVFVVALNFILVAALCCTGCSRRSEAEAALKGFQYVDDGKLPEPITEDYQKYIQSLPAKEREQVAGFDIRGYQDGNGEHAVTIRIPLEGMLKMHLLMYDKDNKRIKTINYNDGHYMS